jgi:hypothetical protein
MKLILLLLLCLTAARAQSRLTAGGAEKAAAVVALDLR